MHLLRTSDVAQATLASVAPVFTVVSTCRVPDNTEHFCVVSCLGVVLSQWDFTDRSRAQVRLVSKGKGSFSP